MLNLDMKAINARLYNEGMQDGEKKGEAAALLKLIRRKFNQVPDEITEKVITAKPELVEIWLENILFANSLEDVFAS